MTTKSTTTSGVVTRQIRPLLTTPFVRPPSYGSGQFITTTSLGFYATLIASNPKLDSSCMPSGWDDTSNIEFRPGVCPDGWTMYDIIPKGLTTGTCCSKGFTLDFHYNPIYATHTSVCAENLATATTSINGTSTTDIRPTLSFRVHDPWTVIWEDFYRKSLTPTPPPLELCENVVVRTWVPGSTVDPMARETCPGQQHEPNILGPAYVYIWAPILGVTLIPALCVTICCLKKRERVVQPGSSVASQRS